MVALQGQFAGYYSAAKGRQVGNPYLALKTPVIAPQRPTNAYLI